MKKIFRSIICLSICFYIFIPKAHASSCYTKAEAEAEQAIRIHSELMVIGLNCQHMRFSDGTNLYAEYRAFTSNHGDLFASYEDRLLSYFKRQGKDPESSVNTLRTIFANKISHDVAKMKPDQFCNRYASRILKVAHFETADIRRWATTFYPSHPVTRPLCEH
jgi:hypothetical protein